jgi:hypothetical protein
MEKDVIVSCDTREDYNLLMEWADENGYHWWGGGKPDSVKCYHQQDGGYGIRFMPAGKGMEHSDTDWWRKQECMYGEVVLFEDFAAEHGFLPSRLPDDYF